MQNKWMLIASLFLVGCTAPQVKTEDDGNKKIIININEGVVIVDEDLSHRILEQIQVIPEQKRYRQHNSLSDSEKFFPDRIDSPI